MMLLSGNLTYFNRCIILNNFKEIVKFYDTIKDAFNTIDCSYLIHCQLPNINWKTGIG